MGNSLVADPQCSSSAHRRHRGSVLLFSVHCLVDSYLLGSPLRFLLYCVPVVLHSVPCSSPTSVCGLVSVLGSALITAVGLILAAGRDLVLFTEIVVSAELCAVGTVLMSLVTVAAGIAQHDINSVVASTVGVAVFLASALVAGCVTAFVSPFSTSDVVAVAIAAACRTASACRLADLISGPEVVLIVAVAAHDWVDFLRFNAGSPDFLGCSLLSAAFVFGASNGSSAALLLSPSPPVVS
ncbi:hypothetical protein PI124_g20889 [Phytophthora idaei]|nr:hypothetical protein PI125_g22376 [Phytophthora idaei]KAG3234052.1 hypothetical protein PI124_g20889 [Phytophthora idaei]